MLADQNILSLFSRLGLSRSLANNLGLGTQVMPNGQTAGAAINPQMSFSTATSPLSPLTVDQSKLPQLGQNYNYNDLANWEDQYNNQYQNQLGSVLDQRRSALSSDLNNQGKSLFDLANPGILEDLNSRGLFTSPTAVANSQSNALKEIGLQNNQYLNQFDNQALGTQLQAAQNAMDSGLNIRESGLAANLQQGQLNQEDSLARDLAKQQSHNNLINSLIGAGGSIGSGLLYSSLAGHGAGAAAGAAGYAGAPAGAASSFFPGGLGTSGAAGGAGLTGPGGTALGGSGGIGPFASMNPYLGAGAGIGAALAIRNGMDKGTFGNLGNSAIKIAQPFFAPDKTLKSIGNVASNVGHGVSNAVSGVGNSISHAFCFDGMTPITMSDGSVKPICEVNLDDVLADGAAVISTRKSMTNDTVFDYRGVLVTGTHAALDGDTWRRIKDMPGARPRRTGGIVYSLSTTTHRLLIKGMMFADDLESDWNEHLTIDESLSYLNHADKGGCFLCGTHKTDRWCHMFKNHYGPKMCRLCWHKRYNRTHKEKRKKYLKENKERLSVARKASQKTPLRRYAQSKCKARILKKSWTIPFDEYEKLISKPCFYCSDRLNETAAGLDRIDNSRGYEPNNVLPCCARCNRTRGDNWTVEETKIMIRAVMEWRSKKIDAILKVN